MRVDYVVSRFPSPSETFIARELTALAREPGIELGLRSLYPPKDGFVHPSARAFVERVERPSPGAALGALGWWIVRRPLRLLGAIATVFATHLHSPPHLLRALATLPIAAAHARSLDRGGVDHLHAHYATYPALAAWLCRRLCGVSYSFTAHAHDLYVDQSMLARKLADASFVATISEFNRRFLAEYGGDMATPVKIVRAGIETASYAFRARVVPASGPVRALCVASLQEYKGHAVLLDALAAEPEALARVELDLVGSGELRERLEDQALRLGLGGRVRFLGNRDEDEVRRLLADADLFVLPSIIASDGQMEGLPVVLMESLASGLPTVATDLSGVGELISEGVTGYLAEPGDPQALAAALVRCLEHSGELDLAGARERVETEFDVSISAATLARLFRALG